MVSDSFSHRDGTGALSAPAQERSRFIRLFGVAPEKTRRPIGLRKATDLTYLPRALLTAALHAHELGQDPAAARRCLDEAQQIAERGPMPLFLADVHLHRARLVGMSNAECRMTNVE